MLRDAKNLKQVGQEFANEASGSLTIATTHTQARYALPSAIQHFTARYPKVRLVLRQGNPTQIAELVTSGVADIAIATEAIELFSELVMLPCYQWNRCVIVPARHPLLKLKELTLEAIAEHPIITYDFAFTGRSKINQAFDAKGLVPNVVLTAIDADVIKTYVELGLGIGILAQMAFEPSRDRHLRAIDASHLFEPSTTRIGISRNSYLRKYVYDFIEMFAPHLDRATVAAAMTERP
jgi:LysR family cys regulon transcriptional activator